MRLNSANSPSSRTPPPTPADGAGTDSSSREKGDGSNREAASGAVRGEGCGQGSGGCGEWRDGVGGVVVGVDGRMGEATLEEVWEGDGEEEGDSTVSSKWWSMAGKGATSSVTVADILDV